MPKKSYVIHWRDVYGKTRMNYFVPLSYSIPTPTGMVRCTNPRKSAQKFVAGLKKYGFPVTQIISGYRRF